MVIVACDAPLLHAYAVALAVVASSITESPGHIAGLLAVITGCSAVRILTATGADRGLGQPFTTADTV
jgi:hypothetical protein